MNRGGGESFSLGGGWFLGVAFSFAATFGLTAVAAFVTFFPGGIEEDG